MNPTKEYQLVVSWSAVSSSQIADMDDYGGEGICDGDAKQFLFKIKE